MKCLAIVVALTVSIASGYRIKSNGVNCRSGPGTSYPVLKTYNEGTEVSLVCQSAGEIIKGDSLWDKTSDGCYVADYYVATGSSTFVVSQCIDKDGSLSGLDTIQSSHARSIINEAKVENLGLQGCLAGITTALVESEIRVLANKNVPESLKYPSDGIGSDYDSVGIFQQRAKYYPNIAADMDPARSAAQFFAEMKRIRDWQSMDVGLLCQKVQRSAHPERYSKRVQEAKNICGAGNLWPARILEKVLALVGKT